MACHLQTLVCKRYHSGLLLVKVDDEIYSHKMHLLSSDHRFVEKGSVAHELTVETAFEGIGHL